MYIAICNRSLISTKKKILILIPISQYTASHVTVDTYHGITIASLMSMILKKARDNLTGRYKVFHNEKELEDHLTLPDNDISDGETLYLKQVLKLLITIVKTPQEGIHY